MTIEKEKPRDQFLELLDLAVEEGYMRWIEGGGDWEEDNEMVTDYIKKSIRKALDLIDEAVKESLRARRVQ